MASTITFQVTQTGFPNANRVFNLQDSEVNRMVAAYQSAANAAINGTATRAQVLNYWVSSVMRDTIEFIRSTEVQVAVAAIPPVTPINPS